MKAARTVLAGGKGGDDIKPLPIGHYLVAVTNHSRCGYVPGDVNFGDVMEYVDIENPIDAATLATGLRYLIRNGFHSETKG